MRQRISIEDASLFTAVVTEGSVAAAARSLGVPKSTATRRMRALQEDIGVPLFAMRDGALRPTEAGVRFAERFASVIEAAEEAHQSIAAAAARPKGAVRILSPTLLGPQFLGDLVAGFLARHAEVAAEVELSDHPPPTISDRIDVVLQLDAAAPDPSVIARRLGEVEQILCASPGFLVPHGTPAHPEDLARSRAVVHGEALSAASFALRVRGVSMTASCPARLTVNHATAAYRAVLAGLGIGALPLPLVRADLAEGRLLRVLPEAELQTLSLYALVPSRRHMRPVVRALLDHISLTLREQTPPTAAVRAA